MKSERKTTVGRRDFLRALGAGAGVAATALVRLRRRLLADNEKQR